MHALGLQQGRYGEEDFVVDPTKHTAILGSTGTGKSSLMKNMIIRDIQAGLGVTVEDPHGDLIDDILPHIPRWRQPDVIYFDPNATSLIPLNILSGRTPPKSISSLISIISTIWPDGWGPQSDFICTNASRAVLAHNPHATILSLHRFLLDKNYRETVFKSVSEPDLLTFQTVYDTEWQSRQRDTATAPLLNKVNKFVANPYLRDIMGQPACLDFRDALDSSKIILCRLSKGVLGDDIAALLGSVIFSKLFIAAAEREDTRDRPPHKIYADEVQNFVHGIKLPTVLSEARKYALTVILATQTLSQLPDPTAVFGNCANILCYRTGGEDALKIGKELLAEDPSWLANRITELSNFNFYGKTIKNNQPTVPIQVKAYPPMEPQGNESPVKTVLEQSAMRWGTDKAVIQEKIHRFLSG